MEKKITEARFLEGAVVCTPILIEESIKGADFGIHRRMDSCDMDKEHILLWAVTIRISFMH